MMNKEAFTKIVNSKTPRKVVPLLERGPLSHIVKTHCFFKNSLLYSKAFPEFCKLYDPGTVLMLRRGDISHILKIHYILLLKNPSSLLPDIAQTT